MTLRPENLRHITSENYLNYKNSQKGRFRSIDRELIKLMGERESVLDLSPLNNEFLDHCTKLYPGIKVYGRDNKLNDIDLIEPSGHYDAIIARSSYMQLTDEEYKKALLGSFSALKPGGVLINCEWLTETEFAHRIFETHPTYLDELLFCIRPVSFVQGALRDAGFTDIYFKKFDIDIDLKSNREVSTQTKKMADGQRLQFRGDLHQPWMFYSANKP